MHQCALRMDKMIAQDGVRSFRIPFSFRSIATLLKKLNCSLGAKKKKSNKNEAMSILFYENTTLHQKPRHAEKLMEVVTSKVDIKHFARHLSPYRLLLHIYSSGCVPRRGNCTTIVLPHTAQEITEPKHKPQLI